MAIIKWTNKYSGESGFVQSVSTKGKHFINTFEFDFAKKYKSADIARRIVNNLIAYGEGENNEFEIIAV